MASGAILSRLPVLYSARCSKAKELDMLSFMKLFMKVSFLNGSKIQKEPNFDSLRQQQEGPGDLRSADSAGEALLLKMQFLFREFLPACDASLETLPL